MPPPSLGVIAVMLLMLAGAGYVFWRLTHHWTRGRRIAALQEWARAAGMKLHVGEAAALPSALARLGPEPRALLSIHGQHTWIVQLETQSSKANEPPRRWHALVRQLGVPSPLVGLRPAHAPASLLDLVPARTFPGLLAPERFVAIGEERAAAEALVASSVRALVPADVGLVLLDDSLVIDFSSRPYDGIEFSRLLAVVDQITPHLPQDARVRST
jgi:hypothetical protein